MGLSDSISFLSQSTFHPWHRIEHCQFFRNEVLNEWKQDEQQEDGKQWKERRVRRVWISAKAGARPAVTLVHTQLKAVMWVKSPQSFCRWWCFLSHKIFPQIFLSKSTPPTSRNKEVLAIYICYIRKENKAKQRLWTCPGIEGTSSSWCPFNIYCIHIQCMVEKGRFLRGRKSRRPSSDNQCLIPVLDLQTVELWTQLEKGSLPDQPPLEA